MARLALVMALALAACGDPPARVRLQPIDLGDCGKPSRSEVTSLRVIAYAPSGEHPRTVALDASGVVELSDIPGDTEQLGVELSGPSGVVAAGKTAPLALSELADGAAIAIAVLPLAGLCRVGDLGEARARPLVSRAAGGVLIAGGFDGTGAPLSTAEFYDAATAQFVPVTVPPELVDATNGLAGGVLAALPDGRVALTGTAAHAIAIFDPAKLAFGAAQLFDHRAYHAALATAADRLFVIGGCADVVGAACSGPALHSAFAYHVDDLSQRDPGPVLPDASVRLGAQLFDLGIQRDGVRRFALAGGTGDAGASDRFALADATTQTITGLGAQVAALDGGALVSAFAPDGDPALGAASQLAPDAAAPTAIAGAPAVAGARLVSLEDGSVLAVGGLPAGELARYSPTENAWRTSAPNQAAGGAVTGALVAPALARLDDGSVLVLGGASAQAAAWLYRPSLVGATSGLVVVEPGGNAPGVITAVDAATASHGGATFSIAGDPAFAFVGGVRATTGSIHAAVVVDAGAHVMLLGQALGPGRALAGDLAAGAPAQITRLDGGTTTVVCTGAVVPAFDPAATTAIGLEVTGHTASVSVGGQPLATCDLGSDASAGDRGAWGLAAVGGTRVGVVTVTVSR